MNANIREAIREYVTRKIDSIIEDYDFAWAIDDTLETMDLREDIEEAIFNDLCENSKEYIGDAIDEVIDEEVSEKVRAVFEN